MTSARTIPNPAAVDILAVSFTVPGSSGTAYTVACDPRDGAVLSCTCPSHQKGHRECKHMKLIATPDHGGLKPRVRVRPRPAVAPISVRDLYDYGDNL